MNIKRHWYENIWQFWRLKDVCEGQYIINDSKVLVNTPDIKTKEQIGWFYVYNPPIGMSYNEYLEDCICRNTGYSLKVLDKIREQSQHKKEANIILDKKIFKVTEDDIVGKIKISNGKIKYIIPTLVDEPLPEISERQFKTLVANNLIIHYHTEEKSVDYSIVGEYYYFNIDKINQQYKQLNYLEENMKETLFTLNLEIEKVIFNEPATIVFWSNGDKTVVKCQKGDKFDKEKGIALAVTKYVSGNKSNYNNVIKKFIDMEA